MSFRSTRISQDYAGLKKLLNDGTIVELKLFDQKSKNFLRLLIIFLED